MVFDFAPVIFSPCLQDDLSATLDEPLWFHAAEHVEELRTFARGFKGTRYLHLIDIFGYSKKMSQAWSKRGYKAAQYDILLGGRSDDILSKRGFLNLVRC